MFVFFSDATENDVILAAIVSKQPVSCQAIINISYKKQHLACLAVSLAINIVYYTILLCHICWVVRR